MHAAMPSSVPFAEHVQHGRGIGSIASRHQRALVYRGPMRARHAITSTWPATTFFRDRSDGS